jgi:stage II sporulation protein D
VRRRAFASAFAAVLLLPVLPLVAGSGVASAAVAAESYTLPASGVFNITGHAWGHGIGMSQWGAEGAASLGVPASTIVSTYYPGTQPSVLANTSIRIKLSGTNSHDLAVLPAPGLTVSDTAGHRLTLTAPATMWRVLADSTGQHLQRLVSGAWSPVTDSRVSHLTNPVSFSDPTNMISVVYPSLYSRDYRGTVTSWVVGGGTVIDTATMAMEDYLRGVVPQESSPSWYPAALQAQAIAARTYAAQQRASASIWSTYDICDSSACQAFGGTRLRSATGSVTPVEYPQTDAAIAATAGQIRTYKDAPAFTQFSSSNGGFSVAGSQPYLVAKADPWDGAVTNPMHTWTATLPVSTIQANYPSVGKLQRLVITSRDGNGDWGGRINTVVLQGVDSLNRATSVTTTGAALYGIRPFGAYSDGLRSTWWTITNGAPVSAPASTSPPVKRPYAATLISSPGAITMPANGYAFVTLRWRNDGTSAWPIDGATQLGTDLPGFRNSLSSGWGWPTEARVGNLTADIPGAKSVLPGQTASISFVLWGDSRAKGVTTEAFQPFRYLTAWFGGSASIRITRT